jgi:hypothetical protein
MPKLPSLKHPATLMLLAGWIFGVSAADQPAAPTATGALAVQNWTPQDILASFQKPPWLKDLSLGIKEGYDNNVFLSGVDQKYLPPAYTVPPGGVAALKDLWSWVTSLSPKLGVSFIPLLGDQKLLQTLSFEYAPEFVFYHDQQSESYDAHRFATAIKGKANAFSFGLDDTFTYVDGSNIAPTYPGGFVTAYNIGAPRERREQIQDRAGLFFQYDLDKWFVRPTASLLYYDLMTKLLNIAGYQNYVDRYDVNGGPDFGYKIDPHLAVTVGYRYGHQYQQQFSFSPYSSSSDYQRALLGLEGKPWQWLELKIQGGPDFRNYDPDTATHITPVNNRHMITYYGDASLTAKISPKDVLTFRYKQWQWVSSVGKVPYFDSTYDLNYHRKLTGKLGLDLRGRLLTANYNSGNLVPSSQRNDWQYTVSAALNYAFDAHASLTLAYALDLGRNAQEDIVDPQTRDYNHQLVSLAVLLKF